MHAVHHTPAFILKAAPSGEANKLVWLYTRNFGLVLATVQGVRKSGSKLAMQLAEYSLIEADLVRGRDVWRLVNAAQGKSPLSGRFPRELGRSYVRTLSAVCRFCQGEEPHEALFEHLVSCMGAFNTGDVDARSFDTLSLWKVLVLLGYGTVPDPYQPLYASPFSEAVQGLTPEARTALVREMNGVLKEAQL